MNITKLTKMGLEVIRILDAYKGKPKGEIFVGAILFSHLKGKSIKITRELSVKMYGSKSPTA
jgi:hypothetical protein